MRAFMIHDDFNIFHTSCPNSAERYRNRGYTVTEIFIPTNN